MAGPNRIDSAARHEQAAYMVDDVIHTIFRTFFSEWTPSDDYIKISSEASRAKIGGRMPAVELSLRACEHVHIRL